MSCQICYSKRKTRFNTNRISICQNCITLLANLETPVNFNVLQEFLFKIIDRNFMCPTDFELRNLAKKIVTNRTGSVKSIFKIFLSSTSFENECNYEFSRLSQQSIERHNQLRIVKFKELIAGTFKPKEKYNFVNYYRGFAGTGEKDALEGWEKDFIKFYRAYSLNIITHNNQKEQRLSDEYIKSLRDKILKKDGNFCNICKIQGSSVELHLHHIIPLSNYGNNSDNNLVLLCQRCHQKQHESFKISKNRKESLNLSKFISIDIETTGLSSKKNEIIEIAAVKFDKGRIIDRFNELICPSCSIPEVITLITGITNASVIGKPTFDNIKERFIQFIADEKLVFHHAAFDLRFLRKYGVKVDNEYYDTLQIAKTNLPNLRCYKLEHLLNIFRISNTCSHRALGDAEATGYLFINISKL